jgi:hypothetical protein
MAVKDTPVPTTLLFCPLLPAVLPDVFDAPPAPTVMV